MLTVTRHYQCPMPPCMLQGSLVQGIISALAIYASLLQCSLLQGIISALCLPVTAARHHQCPMPPCHCCKASPVPYASLSLLQGITSALCLPVTAARHHQCPVTAARHHQCPVTAARHHQCPVTAARHHQCPVTAKRHHQCPVTAARHHQCPMPPYYKAHCCKASSVPYASLLQDSLLQAPRINPDISRPLPRNLRAFLFSRKYRTRAMWASYPRGKI